MKAHNVHIHIMHKQQNIYGIYVVMQETFRTSARNLQTMIEKNNINYLRNTHNVYTNASKAENFQFEFINIRDSSCLYSKFKKRIIRTKS